MYGIGNVCIGAFVRRELMIAMLVHTQQAIGWRVMGEYGIPLIIAYTTRTHELPSKLNTIYYN